MSDQDSGATAPLKLTLIPKPTGPAPAHAIDPRAGEHGTNVTVARAALFDILTELKKLAPCHKDPHRYHERKDELVSRLHHLATAS